MGMEGDRNQVEAPKVHRHIPNVRSRQAQAMQRIGLHMAAWQNIGPAIELPD